MARRYLPYLLLLVILGSCSQKQKKIPRMIYLEGAEGTVQQKRGLTTYYTITIQNPSDTFFVFYLAPLEDVDPISITRFLSYWESDESGVSHTAGRAAVIIKREDGESIPSLFKIQDPTFDPQTKVLQFNAHSGSPVEKNVLEKLSGKITLLIESDHNVR